VRPSHRNSDWDDDEQINVKKLGHFKEDIIISVAKKEDLSDG